MIPEFSKENLQDTILHVDIQYILPHGISCVNDFNNNKKTKPCYKVRGIKMSDGLSDTDMGADELLFGSHYSDKQSTTCPI